MQTIMLPYGKEKIPFHIEESHLAGVLTTPLQEYTPEMEEDELVWEALRHPIGTKPLSELAKGKEKVVIISSDHTRPVPSKVILPKLLAEIRSTSPAAEITILIATGLHRATTKEELREKYGDDIFLHERIVVHNCDDTANLVDMGTLPSGGRLQVNRLAAEADLLVAEGFIEPHFFAGFSGGRKSVLPGICGRETVMYNHNAAFLDSPYARTGVLEGNPVHRDMLYAAKKAKLAFICNVVLNSNHRILKCVAGDVEQAHAEGVAFLRGLCGVKPAFADIAVSTNGGYPLDRNIYQAVKGMTAAAATLREGGVIVMLAKSEDGHGGEGFFGMFHEEKDLRRMMETFLARKKEETIPDQWQSQIFARVLLEHPVIYVSDADADTVRELHMIPAQNIDEAMAIAVDLVQKNDYTVAVIPDGVSVIVG